MIQTVENNRALDQIISSIGDLPASPAIIASLMGLTSDVNSDLEDITKAVLADQSLTARILKLSNSSFYGRAKEVTTLKEAVVLLGLKTLRSLVVAASAHKLYSNSGGDAQGKLWEHSLAVAIASRVFAKAIKYPQNEDAFTAGLLHDIGKLVLLQKKPKEFVEIIEQTKATGNSFASLEIEKLGFDHSDIGRLLLQKWSFPEILIEAVSSHHDDIMIDPDNVTLAMIVSVGNKIAKRLQVGYDRAVDESELVELLGRFGLDEIDARDFFEAMAEQYSSEQSIYNS